ncbi:tetratricopeptide repeat protein [Legionella spiritensis]|uniref:Enhanced entry protein EnhC n=1 Tax=Legionella spiritensis TaxID=452 RepID=A0A0W0Z6B6_LEGSP|nr:tetratricopeptide repeat protein [Legionella spiritensis]KTD64262.1 enhanced entry protein EnhC [Legionella spiritensis]SNV47059.1 enhanced entry protein EnhC [Legionella spiritensis]
MLKKNSGQSPQSNDVLDIAKLSKPQLIEIIAQQLLEGDYRYTSLWCSIIKSSSKKQKSEDSKAIRNTLAQTIEICEQEIRKDNANAMVLRALMHQYGQGGPVETAEAIRLYEQAINLGHAKAMICRAIMHLDSYEGMDKYPKAIRLTEQAMDLGDDSAINNRAYMHDNGIGGDKNVPEAIHLLEQAIAMGNSEAMNCRAHMHRHGKGGDKNIPAAICLLEQAIDLGSDYAISMRNHFDVEMQGKNPEEAGILLDLLWDKLLQGVSFTEQTLSLLGQQVKALALGKLTTEKLSLESLLPITQKSHPLANILNYGGNATYTREYLAFLEHVKFLQMKEAVFKIAEDNTNYLHLFFGGKNNSPLLDASTAYLSPGIQLRDNENPISDVTPR